MNIQAITNTNSYKPVFKNNNEKAKNSTRYTIYTGPSLTANDLLNDMEKDPALKNNVEGYLKRLGISIKEFFSPKVVKEAEQIQNEIDDFYSRVWVA